MIDIKALLELHDIPENLVKKIMPFLSIVKLKRGETLVHPGEVCQRGFLIVRGGLILSYLNPNDNEDKVVNFFLPTIQPFCTVWDSYFKGNKSEGKLVAVKNTLVISINKMDLENTITSDPEILHYYLYKLNETLVFENNLRIKLLTTNPEQFYQFLLEEHPQIIQQIPTKYIAQFMGISREWLSKIKSIKGRK